MTGRLVDLSLSIDRKQRLTIEVDSDFRADFDKLKDDMVAVEVKKFRKRRSLDSNAYAWVLCDKLAEALSESKANIYREAIRNIGGVSDTVCVPTPAVEKLCRGWAHNGLGWQTETTESKIPGCTNVIMYYGSTSYDTAQMSRLIDILVQDAKELGIETLPPDELARMEALWNEKQQN